MSAVRTVALSLSGTCLFLGVFGGGCGTDAVGVDDCREVEAARCESGPACGLVEDVDACKRFFRDHCLHGLRSGKASAPDVSACASAMRGIGTCVAGGGDKPVVECPEVGVGTDRVSGTLSACQALNTPERLPQCEFLTPNPEPIPDAGPDSSDSGASDAASDGPTE